MLDTSLLASAKESILAILLGSVGVGRFSMLIFGEPDLDEKTKFGKSAVIAPYIKK